MIEYVFDHCTNIYVKFLIFDKNRQGLRVQFFFRSSVVKFDDKFQFRQAETIREYPFGFVIVFQLAVDVKRKFFDIFPVFTFDFKRMCQIREYRSRFDIFSLYRVGIVIQRDSERIFLIGSDCQIILFHNKRHGDKKSPCKSPPPKINR